MVVWTLQVILRLDRELLLVVVVVWGAPTRA